MRLPIPIFSGEVIHQEVEIESPRAGVLADTQKIAEQGNWFTAIHILVGGCVTSIGDITDKSTIRNLCRKMPYRSAELVALKATLLISPDDGFEGVYVCPRCGHKIITDYQEADGEVIIDTRDFVSNLKVGIMEEETRGFHHDMTEPVDIKSEGEVIESIDSFDMRYPLLADCIASEGKHGNNDPIRSQFGTYVQALTAINGNNVDAKWKNRYGMALFNGIHSLRGDLLVIGREMEKYGLSTKVDKTCTDCGKEYRAQVNTSGFFESVLRM